MLQTPLIIIFAVGLPYLLCAFVQQSLEPEQWLWYTRAILAIIYAWYGYIALDVMASLRRKRIAAMGKSRL